MAKFILLTIRQSTFIGAPPPKQVLVAVNHIRAVSQVHSVHEDDKLKPPQEKRWVEDGCVVLVAGGSDDGSYGVTESLGEVIDKIRWDDEVEI